MMMMTSLLVTTTHNNLVVVKHVKGKESLSPQQALKVHPVDPAALKLTADLDAFAWWGWPILC